ncbi:DUF2795 domain-containing protein [Arthrobacter sp. M4]|uniref:DUF2795 domain-containing protein n=1 Tax=Arthrobacter sp. M4 TaxID=218160 RepID=UPI001CDC87C4|nr:DUF2795 domain-containing protein [Arthrobacter sp. M4]MCA4135516.1 DUF2795 domain-containing protein [Arthrobacter sp. M4]
MAETPNPIQVQKFLGGIDYPASKDALVSRAKDEGADQNILDALENLPDKEYGAPTEVTSALSG